MKIINYIKNNEEKKITTNRFNIKRIMKEIFTEQSYETDRRFHYKINEKIEYLYLKNMKFFKNGHIECPKNTILVLDNCIFEEEKLLITGGIVQLINPIFAHKYFQERQIEIISAKETNITINSELDAILKLNSEKISIDANNNKIKKINILNEDKSIKEVNLRNIAELKNSSTIISDKINITNSNITTTNNESIELKSNNIIIDNNTSITSKNIIINEMNITNTNSITLNNNDFDSILMTRLRLISVLNKVKEKINNSINKELNPIIEKNNKELEKIKKSQDNYLKRIENKQKGKVKTLKRNLQNNKISNYNN